MDRSGAGATPRINQSGDAKPQKSAHLQLGRPRPRAQAQRLLRAALDAGGGCQLPPRRRVVRAALVVVRTAGTLLVCSGPRRPAREGVGGWGAGGGTAEEAKESGVRLVSQALHKQVPLGNPSQAPQQRRAASSPFRGAALVRTAAPEVAALAHAPAKRPSRPLPARQRIAQLTPRPLAAARPRSAPPTAGSSGARRRAARQPASCVVAVAGTGCRV